MKTILAPTDFSSSSINAVEYAADLATEINCQLCIINVAPYPVTIPEIPVSISVVDELIEMGKQDLENLVRDMKERVHEKISVTSELLTGTIELQLKDIADRYQPTAIVIGLKPGRTFERSLMGSTVFFLMNHVHYPTLIVPENFIFHPIRNIGLACDMKKSSLWPKQMIFNWLSLFTASFHLIYVTINNKRFEKEQYMESESLREGFARFKPELHYLEGSNLSGELNDFARTHHLDLLIIVPRTHSPLNIFHGAYSKYTVRNEVIPTLSIHE